jgi:dihydrodipicolinate synthase/N-acetylneuraminate lyase
MRINNLFGLTSARVQRVRQSRRYRPPAGLSVPIVTVLDRSGRVIADQQREVIRYAVQDGAGANVIFAAGTTGEWDKLDNRRRQLVATIAVEECHRIAHVSGTNVEAWVGITARSRAETLDNLVHALELNADAVVVAPLSIEDVDDCVDFVTRDIGAVYEEHKRALPLFLYDNADIAAAGKSDHLHTRDVKRMSRLGYVRGVKVTAGKAVLGNYMRAASHFKRKGEFVIYPGNAYLIFDLFQPRKGMRGQIRHYWNRYLTQNSLPHGVVAGASNVMPREWQRGWQVCEKADSLLMRRYSTVLEEYRDACEFSRGGKPYRPTIACIKAALSDIGVCSSEAVAPGTPELSEGERREFIRRLRFLRRRAAATLEPEWLSEWGAKRPMLRQARRDG